MMMPAVDWYRSNILQRILQARQTNPVLNSFIGLVNADNIALQKTASEQRWRAGQEKSGLDGIPFAVKDIFCTSKTFVDDQNRPLRTTCASAMLRHHVSPYTADVVTQLGDGMGMILVGKTNMDEFAMGSFTVNSHFGPCRNPLDLSRSPGGSSGGSAAAVASQIVPIALGSDTGGSIRLPAAYCNLVGFKPSYGVLSRYGMVAHASSLDTVGLLCNGIDTLQTFWASFMHNFNLAVSDPLSPMRDSWQVRDSTCGHVPSSSTISGSPILRIGILDRKSPQASPQDEYWDGLHHLALVSRDFAQLIPVELPWLEQCVSAYYIISSIEAASCLSRFNGLCYERDVADEDKDKEKGKSMSPMSFHDFACQTRTRSLGKEVQRRILLGTYLASSRGPDDTSPTSDQLARNFRYQIQRAWDDLFIQNSLDAIVIPSCVSPPPYIDQLLQSTTDNYWSKPDHHWMQDIWTVPANLLGVPALTMPISYIHHRIDSSFPALHPSWQWMARRGNDEALIRISKQIHDRMNGP